MFSRRGVMQHFVSRHGAEQQRSQQRQNAERKKERPEPPDARRAAHAPDVWPVWRHASSLQKTGQRQSSQVSAGRRVHALTPMVQAFVATDALVQAISLCMQYDQHTGSSTYRPSMATHCGKASAQKYD